MGWELFKEQYSSGILTLLDMPTSPVIEEYESIIITDSTPSSIEVGQVYQDKETIATAMKHYSVMHKFQFRVKRSSARSGWKYCRPIVVVDGIFLKSAYRGIMLIASTIDAAGTILPLTYAVVDSENVASWKWFFEQFKLAYGERANMCVVSDRNKSILKATSIVYPGMPHHSYMWHIWTNIWAKFKKGHLKLSELYFATVRSYTLDEFNERMSKIEEIVPRVKAYLYDIGYYRWSRVHATVNRTWTMTSNIAESLNVITKYVRELPIVELLKYMRTLLERWTKVKLLKAKGTFIYPGYKFNKELDDNRTLSHKLRVRASTDYIHTVIDEYCSPYYTKVNLLRTYEISVNLLPDESKWNVPQHITKEVVNPSKGGKRQPGRPQKERYKTYDEINSKKYKVSSATAEEKGITKDLARMHPK
ncbi:uncharacterized protein [Nicotiana sylvestris]|uniref:uncharacterized protein n=1 Tax=Nicotiana sylvestris TaxID=4096 RepID=UPI00388CCF86